MLTQTKISRPPFLLATHPHTQESTPDRGCLLMMKYPSRRQHCHFVSNRSSFFLAQGDDVTQAGGDPLAPALKTHTRVFSLLSLAVSSLVYLLSSCFHYTVTKLVSLLNKWFDGLLVVFLSLSSVQLGLGSLPAGFPGSPFHLSAMWKDITFSTHEPIVTCGPVLMVRVGDVPMAGSTARLSAKCRYSLSWSSGAILVIRLGIVSRNSRRLDTK